MHQASTRTGLQPGTQIGARYTVERQLAAGGMGTVFAALQAPFGRRVALKIMHPHHQANPEFKARFFREAEAMSQLTHPNTVTVFDFGEASGECFIAMEFVDGQTLGDLIRTQKSLPAEDAIPIAIQIAQSLGEAHQKNIIHRDLKPDNVLISGEEHEQFIKVTDFGIAKMLDKKDQWTQAGNIVGTPFYMAPEQGQSGEVDARTDVYALGCCLYEMLTGAPPFSGQNAVEILLKHRTDTPPSLGPGFPAKLDEFIKRSLAKAPDDRPSDTQTFIAELIGCYASTDWSGPHRQALAQTIDSSSGLAEVTEDDPPPPLFALRELDEDPNDEDPESPGGVEFDHRTERAVPDARVPSSRRASEVPDRDLSHTPASPGRTTDAGRLSRPFYVVTAVATLLLFSLGALWLQSDTKQITFDSSPPTALLKLDGKTVGQTPLTLELDRSKHVVASYSHPTHTTTEVVFDPSVDDRVFANLSPASIEVRVRAPAAGMRVEIEGADHGMVPRDRSRTFRVLRPESSLEVVLRSDSHEDYIVNQPSADVSSVDIAPELADLVPRREHHTPELQ